MELCRLRKGGSEGRRFFFRRAGEGRLPGQYRLQFGPKRKQAAEKKATQDAPLLRFASQPIDARDELEWNAPCFMRGTNARHEPRGFNSGPVDPCLVL